MTQEVDELDPESWEVRETFAYFGRAFYMASVLEVGLAHALMIGEFMLAEREKVFADKGKTFDRRQYEADFDKFMEKQFSQTMGNIIRRVEAQPAIDAALKARIFEAKKRRDFLVHHYWRERSVTFATSDGRAGMRAELNKDAETFRELDRDIERALENVRKRLGIDDEKLRIQTEKAIAKMKAGLPWED